MGALSIRSSLIVASLERYAATLISFSSTLVVARVLSPAEFGLFAIALSVAALAHALREGGVTAYLIQSAEIDRGKIQAAFTSTVILALFAGLGLSLAAPAMANLYGSPDLASLLWLNAGTFLFLPVSATINATLLREMRFGALFWIEMAAAVTQAGLAVTLALNDFGVFALGWSHLAGAAVHAAACLAIGRDFGRYRIRLKGLGEIFRFSAAAGFAIFLNELNFRLFALVAGRSLGASAVGLFERAGAILYLYDRAIAGVYAVALPGLSELHRSGTAMGPPLAQALGLINLTSLAALGCFVILAEPLLVVLYGPQWSAAAPLVAPLAVAAVTSLGLDRLATPIYIAFGRIDLTIRIPLITLPVRLVAMLAATPHGLAAAAWALAAASVATAAAHMFLIPKLAAMPRRAVFAAFGRAVLVCAPGWALALLATRLAGQDAPSLALLVLGGAAFMAGAGGMILWTRHPVLQLFARARSAT